MTTPLYVVFDGPPGPVSGRFVEVETADGRSVTTGGTWHEHPTAPGLWRLGPIGAEDVERLRSALLTIIAQDRSDFDETLEYWEWDNRDDIHRQGREAGYRVAANLARAALATIDALRP